MTTGEESTTKPVLARSLPALSCTPPQTQRAPMRGTQTATTPHSSRIERHTVRGFRRRATRNTHHAAQPCHITSPRPTTYCTFFLCCRCNSFCHTTSLQQPVQFFAKVQCTSTEPTQQFNAPQGTDDSKDFVRTRPHPTLYFH